jgi:hypothetical protein
MTVGNSLPYANHTVSVRIWRERDDQRMFPTVARYVRNVEYIVVAFNCFTACLSCSLRRVP